jgi:hypothetical protein
VAAARDLALPAGDGAAPSTSAAAPSGGGLWTRLAAAVPGRTPKQVRERYTNHVLGGGGRPWSEAAAAAAAVAHARVGNRWSLLAAHVSEATGAARSEAAVKNLMYATARRQVS